MGTAALRIGADIMQSPDAEILVAMQEAGSECRAQGSGTRAQGPECRQEFTCDSD